MYQGGVSFLIAKSFGSLQLVPEARGVRFVFQGSGEDSAKAEKPATSGSLDILVPLEAVGGVWATARAFLYGVESLDENVILQGDRSKPDESDVLIKLYRDRPKGENGKLTGQEFCWLRLVTGRSEDERRRIKLGPRDLMCLELACQSAFQLAAVGGVHKPQSQA